jgi:hypothetical protein
MVHTIISYICYRYHALAACARPKMQCYAADVSTNRAIPLGLHRHRSWFIQKRRATQYSGGGEPGRPFVLNDGNLHIDGLHTVNDCGRLAENVETDDRSLLRR